MQSTITVTKIIKAIADLSGIYLDERCAGYLQTQRGPLLTAIDMDDGEAIAATVTRAIQGALAAAGFKGHLTPDLLRAVISEPTVGVRAIHDAIEKRENALFHLSNFTQQAGRGPFSGAQRGASHAPATPQRSHPGQTPPQRRSAEPAHSHSAPIPPTPQRGASSGPREVPAPSRENHHAPSQDRRPHDEFDDNPLPSGRSRSNSDHQPQASGHRASVSNLDEQRTVRRSYAPNGDQERDNDRSPAEAADDVQSRRREQKNIYGSKASVQFSAGMTKATDKKPPRPTIYMEAARMLNPQSRTYDWNNKIILQMTGHEMQIVTALLFGLVTNCKFANHGNPGETDKWFEFAHQEGNYAGTIKIAIGKGSDVLVCSMGAEDIGDVTAMFIRQCAEQMRLEQAAVPATLRVVANAYNSRNAAKGGQSSSSQGGGQRRYG